MLPKSASVLNTQQLTAPASKVLPAPKNGTGEPLDAEFAAWRVRPMAWLLSWPAAQLQEAWCSPPGRCYCCCRCAQVQHPCILQHFDTFLERVNGKRVAVFLDYDGTFWVQGSSRWTGVCRWFNPPPSDRSALTLPAGTLTPIVNNPDQAIMSPQVGGQTGVPSVTAAVCSACSSCCGLAGRHCSSRQPPHQRQLQLPRAATRHHEAV